MVIERIKHELAITPYILKRYNRKTAARWLKRQENDYIWYEGIYDVKLINKYHKMGFRAKRIETFSSEDLEKYVSDLDYLSLDPINNSYGKWINDYNTFKRVVFDMQDIFPEIYFSFFRRGDVYVNTWPMSDGKITMELLMAFLEKNPHKEYEFRPAFFKSKAERHILKYIPNRGICLDDDIIISKEKFRRIINSKTSNYLLMDRVKYMKFNNKEFFIKFYIANDSEDVILEALLEEVDVESDTGKQYPINLEFGYVKEIDIHIPEWNKTIMVIKELSEKIKQIRFFTLSIVINSEGKVKVKSASDKPFLPRIPYSDQLLSYVKGLVMERKSNIENVKTRYNKIKRSLFAKWVAKHCPNGMRPYMEKMWLYSLKEDFKYKGTTLKQKKWSWNRGFLSYRIEQYNLTEDNYMNYLSDYQYHWLNRINNYFQIWINDKTTFRYVLEPFKDNIPKYYFNIFRQGDNLKIEKMIDCPSEIENSVDGIINLLELKEKLVFKASAGTHGDGFYCLEFKGNKFYANGEEKDREEIEKIIVSQKSYYLVTSYINMSSGLKKIYPQSVNTIRVAVVNRHGYNPEIMQTYMRIGSSKTGYTDNVGYGGICAMIDIETGKLYNPEKLVDHKYIPCLEHPDTKVRIDSLTVPHWKEVCEGVKRISRLMPELEYLGFDVAITEESFEIVEINIHQDLHKVADHSDKYRQFYKDKIIYKMGINHIDDCDKKNMKVYMKED